MEGPGPGTAVTVYSILKGIVGGGRQLSEEERRKVPVQVIGLGGQRPILGLPRNEPLGRLQGEPLPRLGDPARNIVAPSPPTPAPPSPPAPAPAPPPVAPPVSVPPIGEPTPNLPAPTGNAGPYSGTGGDIGFGRPVGRGLAAAISRAWEFLSKYRNLLTLGIISEIEDTLAEAATEDIRRDTERMARIQERLEKLIDRQEQRLERERERAERAAEKRQRVIEESQDVVAQVRARAQQLGHQEYLRRLRIEGERRERIMRARAARIEAQGKAAAEAMASRFGLARSVLLGIAGLAGGYIVARAGRSGGSSVSVTTLQPTPPPIVPTDPLTPPPGTEPIPPLSLQPGGAGLTSAYLYGLTLPGSGGKDTRTSSAEQVCSCRPRYTKRRRRRLRRICYERPL